MQGKTLKKIRRGLPEIGDDQKAFGEVVGRSRYSVSGYETGREDVPTAVANLAITLDLFRKLAPPEAYAILLRRLERDVRGEEVESA